MRTTHHQRPMGVAVSSVFSPELCRIADEYVHSQRSHTLSIYADDFPERVRDLWNVEPRRDIYKITRLVLTDGNKGLEYQRFLSDENAAALTDLLNGLKSLSHLVIRLGYLPGRLMERIRGTLKRLSGLDLGTGFERWVDCDDALLAAFAGELRAARQLTKLCVGSLSVERVSADNGGGFTLLTELADAVVGMTWLDCLTLVMQEHPREDRGRRRGRHLWYDDGRRPVAKHVHLEFKPNATATINWNHWFFTTKIDRLSVGGYLTDNLMGGEFNWNDWNELAYRAPRERELRLDLHRQRPELIRGIWEPEADAYSVSVLRILACPFWRIHARLRLSVTPELFPDSSFLQRFSDVWKEINAIKSGFRQIKYDITAVGFNANAVNVTEEQVARMARMMAWFLTVTIENAVLNFRNEGPGDADHETFWKKYDNRFVVRVPCESVELLTAAMRAVQMRTTFTNEELLRKRYLEIKALKVGDNDNAET
jgi:hypothetical protein